MRLQLLGQHGSDAPPSVLLMTQREGVLSPLYVFHAPQGLARLASEHGLLSSARGHLAAVFASRPDSTALGGLPGLLFRSGRGGDDILHVCGPQGTAASIFALRHVMSWAYPRVFVTESKEDNTSHCYSDDHVRVQALMVHPRRQKLPTDMVISVAAKRTASALQRGQHDSRPSGKKPRSDIEHSETANGNGQADGSTQESSSESSDESSSDEDHTDDSSTDTEDNLGDEQARSSDGLPLAADKPSAKYNPVQKSFTNKRRSTHIPNNQRAAAETSASGARGHSVGAQPSTLAVYLRDWQSAKFLRADTLSGLPHTSSSTTARCLGFLCRYRLDDARPLSQQNEGLLLILDCQSANDARIITAHPGFHVAKLQRLDRPLTVVHFSRPAIQLHMADWINATAAIPSCRHVRLQSTARGGSCPLHCGARLALRTAARYRLAVQQMAPTLAPVCHCCVAAAKGIHPLEMVNLAQAAPSPTLSRDTTSSAEADVFGSSSWPAALERHLVFLGTGCAEPSKLRGSSGIFMVTDSRAAILLDCGEGIVSQMVHLWGEENAIAHILSLRLVWISHQHADHCLGLPAILDIRQQRGKHVGPLLVIGPSSVGRWLQESCDFSADTLIYATFDAVAKCLLEPDFADFVHYTLVQLSLSNLESIRVEHCHEAHALQLTFASGWRLAYSGDTRPSANLMSRIGGVDLLIHEATFAVEDRDQALQRAHSTIEEAVLVAAQTGARALICTHFSQRFTITPQLPRHLSGSSIAAVAFDGMCIDLEDLAHVPQQWQAAADFLAAEVEASRSAKETLETLAADRE